MRHARTIYPVRVKRDDRAPDRLLVCKLGEKPITVTAEIQLELQDRQAVATSVDYTPIFGVKGESELPDQVALDALATAMRARPYRASDSNIPAGYTYLGQFIFHDITWMKEGLKDKRTPALDLDSVLPGLKPADFSDYAAADGLFEIGLTTELPLPEDLPRVTELYHPERFRPRIEDRRNDDFLPLSQSHLLLLKFYNAAARSLGYDGTARDDGWWRKLRTLWVQHFQSVVLHDYLPRIVDRDTYDDVMTRGRKLVRTGATDPDPAWLPVEFAGAVGRFGHSMIRDGYSPWNRRQAWTQVTVQDFMALSYANSGDRLAEGFHFTWVSNWLNLFDFSGTALAVPPVTPIMAAAIDTHLAPTLGDLQGCLLADICDGSNSGMPKLDLAKVTLARGRELGLVGAHQAIIETRQRTGLPLPELTVEQLFPEDEGLGEVTRAHEALIHTTPLWYYVLREAEVLGNGKLGPFGGRIVMETLHAAIAASQGSILGGGWTTTFPPANRDHYTMPDLILFSTRPDPLDFQE